MTNEETLDWLCRLRSKMLIYMPKEIVNNEMYEALDTVIKALKQEPVLDKIRAEIENTEIVGHIRDVECFNAGINVALNVINKYMVENEEKI